LTKRETTAHQTVEELTVLVSVSLFRDTPFIKTDNISCTVRLISYPTSSLAS
jgi:hypothetical protein